MMKPETCALKLFQRLLRSRVNAELDETGSNIVTVKTPGFALHVVYHKEGMTAAYPYKIEGHDIAAVLPGTKWKKHTVAEVARWVTEWYAKRSST